MPTKMSYIVVDMDDNDKDGLVANIFFMCSGKTLGVMKIPFGPNISDVTISVLHPKLRIEAWFNVYDGQYLQPMPVIRYPNFTDKTADCTHRFHCPFGW